MPKKTIKKYSYSYYSGAITVAIIQLLFEIPILVVATILATRDVKFTAQNLIEVRENQVVQQVRVEPNRIFHMLNTENEQIVWAFLLSLFVIGLICNVLVVAGVLKKKHYLLLPFLIFEAVFAGLYVIFTIAGLVQTLEGNMLFMVMAMLIVLPLSIYVYMWLVVYSHYAILQQENNRGRYDKQPYRR